MEDIFRVLEGLGLVFTIFCFYFLPALIAGIRDTRNAVAIMAVNLFLGWTFLVWLTALIWSLFDEKKERLKK